MTTPSTPIAATLRSALPSLVVWGLLALLLAVVVGDAADAHLLALVVIGFAAIAAMATRLHQLLIAARDGRIVRRDDGRVYRSVVLVPATLVVALVVSVPLGLLIVWREGSAAERGALVVLATLASTLAARTVFRRDLAASWRARRTGLVGWLVVDGALPVALVSGPFGALVLAARLSGGMSSSPGSIARHFATSIVLYALLLGVAGFAKATRERVGGLVDAELHARVVPSPIAVGGAAAVIVLFVVPRLALPADAASLIALKGALGFVCALGFFTLGALRAASREGSALVDARAAR